MCVFLSLQIFTLPAAQSVKKVKVVMPGIILTLEEEIK